MALGTTLACADPAGVRFTKIAADGRELSDAEGLSQWSCLRDDRSGLTWEIKATGGGPRDSQWTYTPYDSNPRTNGGYPGYKDKTSGKCVRGAMEGGSCNTEAYVRLLQKLELCGHDDWRLPTVSELVAVSAETSSGPPAGNESVLPNTAPGWYWTGIETTGQTRFSRVILLPPGAAPQFYDGSYLVIGVRGESPR